MPCCVTTQHTQPGDWQMQLGIASQHQHKDQHKLCYQIHHASQS